jgi:hypothetical protein
VVGYRKLLENPEFRGNYGVSSSWKTIFDQIRSSRFPFYSYIFAIYGLIEPFNEKAVEEMIAPNLKGNELKAVHKILEEERRHIKMFDVFEELCATELEPGQKEELKALARTFLGEFSHGISLPSGEKVSFEKSSKWDFLRQVNSITQRMLAW